MKTPLTIQLEREEAEAYARVTRALDDWGTALRRVAEGNLRPVPTNPHTPGFGGDHGEA